MELRQLKYFIAVYEDGQFVKAAQKMHITQSALSQQIFALERELGAELFDKQKRKITRVVEATQIGHDFYKDAKKIVDLSDRAKAKIMEKGKTASQIRLGTYQLLNKKQIINTLEKIRSIHKNVEFNIVEFENPIEVQDAILDNAIDCGISILPLNSQEKLEYQYLSEVKMCLLIHSDHKMNGDVSVQLDGLNTEKWVEINHKIHPIYKDIGLYCQKAGLTNRQIVQEAPSLELLCHFVDVGKGIAFAPSYIDISDFPHIVKKPISSPFITLEQIFCFKKVDRRKFEGIEG